MSAPIIAATIRAVLPIVAVVGVIIVLWLMFGKNAFSKLGQGLGNATGNVVKGGVRGMSSFSRSMNSTVYGKIAKPKDKFDRVAVSTGLGGGAVVAAKHSIENLFKKRKRH
jgi:hypothetical protein